MYCCHLFSRQKLDQDPICLCSLRNRAVKVKDTTKGSPISLPLNPFLPLWRDKLAGLKVSDCLLQGYFKEKEMLPQEIQPGMTGLETFKACFLQRLLHRPQRRFLGLAEVFPA